MAEESKAVLRVKGFLISPELFETGFQGGAGPCRCSSVCCEGGVFADVAERARILEHRHLVKKYMDGSQTTDESRWFEDREWEDPDFHSGRCVGTLEINGKCAFLDRQGRCSLQVAATKEGMGKWALKPLYCILFPLEVSNTTLRFDDMLQSEQKCCTVSRDFSVPLFMECSEELIHLLGDDGYESLISHYRSMKKGASDGNV